MEIFLAHWRADVLPCQPVLQEIPFGHDAVITMRLDCDESIEAARPLWDAYREMNVPFSLAIHTKNLDDPTQHEILREMVEQGQCLLSHTATHAPNWGGSYDAAFQEAIESSTRLEKVTGQRVKYAVSPFHQSPPYALSALADAGYYGCIGGIIRNDPEFVLARGGELGGGPRGFIGHSQQYMLHGECMLAQGDPMAIFKAAFDRALETRTLFGYLDHPFSARYQYGWTDEVTRISMHQELVRHIRSNAQLPLFLSEDQAMNFLRDKAAWQVMEEGTGFKLIAPANDQGRSTLVPTIAYRHKEFAAKHASVLA
jgi:hypothetical protein